MIEDFVVREILASTCDFLPADATVESLKKLTPGPLSGIIEVLNKEPELDPSGQPSKHGSQWKLSLGEAGLFEPLIPRKEGNRVVYEGHINRMDGSHTTFTTFVPSWETLDVRWYPQGGKVSAVYYKVGIRPNATYPQQTIPETQEPLQYFWYLAEATGKAYNFMDYGRGLGTKWTLPKIESEQLPIPVSVPVGTIPFITPEERLARIEARLHALDGL